VISSMSPWICRRQQRKGAFAQRVFVQGLGHHAKAGQSLAEIIMQIEPDSPSLGLAMSNNSPSRRWRSRIMCSS